MAYSIERKHERKGSTYSRLWPFSKPIKKYLTLPSITCGDVIALMEQGAINRSTEIVAFESDPSLVSKIRKRLSSLGLTNAVVYCGRIEGYASLINQSHLERPFDLIYLDFCGEVSESRKDFIASIRGVIRDCRLAATFCILFRHNDLWDETGSEKLDFNKAFFHSVTENVRSVTQKAGYFKYDGLKSRNMMKWIARAEWTAMQVKEAMQINSLSHFALDSFAVYSENGRSAPMFFMSHQPFTVHTKRNRDRILNSMKVSHVKESPKDVKEKNPKSVRAGKLAAITRQINLSESEYAKAKSPAKKACIRKRINDLKRQKKAL